MDLGTVLTSEGTLTNEEFLNAINKPWEIVEGNNGINYYNIPAAFDIEVTSFMSKSPPEKRACMYEWTFGIGGYVTIGRTWEEFIHIYKRTVEILKTHDKLRLMLFVHNLAYEFQFIRKWLSWSNVFLFERYKPLYALSSDGVEFRCSYKLSGKSLEKLGSDLRKYKVQKMVGDLDYSKIRHSGTELTEKELKYCENDVRVVMCYIQEKIEEEGNISNIPLTKTGYVRRYCRNACLRKNGTQWKRYRKLISSLSLDSDEYLTLKRAFSGGFTHANAFYSNKTLSNVASYDFTSSYPYVMLSEMFPMTKGERYFPVDGNDFKNQLRLYCCVFNIEMFDVQSKGIVEHPLSVSHCYEIEEYQSDNGRVVFAKRLLTTITEQDYWVLTQFYTWSNAKVSGMIRYGKNYLPKAFARSILDLYYDKTTLKGVEGKEVDYLLSKEMLNSCYGMCVTDIVRDETLYEDDQYVKGDSDIEEVIKRYNNSRNRFLFYPWGVWVTAYARRNLFTGILACGVDYVYSDTDSVKILNANRHQDYFNSYNESVKVKLQKSATYWGWNPDDFSPVNGNGEPKPLGVWDYEGTYKRFKTLGAKRYMTETDKGISLTVSGVNKKVAIPYLTKKYPDLFEAFEPDLYIERGYTGSSILSYCDEEIQGKVTDYRGVSGQYNERSYIHMEDRDYHLSLSSAYLEYLLGVRNEMR